MSVWGQWFFLDFSGCFSVICRLEMKEMYKKRLNMVDEVIGRFFALLSFSGVFLGG